MYIHELLLICCTSTDGRLSWRSWLTHSGQFTHAQSGHLSTADRAKITESPPVKDQRPNHEATPT